MVRVALEPTRSVALWHCHHRQEAPRGNLGMTYEGTQACFFLTNSFFSPFFHLNAAHATTVGSLIDEILRYGAINSH